jgi:multidrug resistance efflux pump
MWIAGIVLIACVVAFADRTDQRLWKMMKDSIEQDSRQTIQQLQDHNDRLKREKTTLISQQEVLRREKVALQNKVADLEGRLKDIETQLNNIVVPTDIDGLVKELERRGFHPTVLPAK